MVDVEAIRFLETRALLMDEGVRNVRTILVAKDGIERGTTLVPIGKHAQDGPSCSERSLPTTTVVDCHVIRWV